MSLHFIVKFEWNGELLLFTYFLVLIIEKNDIEYFCQQNELVYVLYFVY